MQSKQNTFTQLNKDVNPSAMNTEKGMFFHGKDGSLIGGEGNTFKWVSDNGTEKVFTIPYSVAEPEKKTYAKAELYFFDGRHLSFGEKVAGTKRRSFVVEIYTNNVLYGKFVVVAKTLDESPTSVYFGIEGYLGVASLYEPDISGMTRNNWSVEHCLLKMLYDKLNTIPVYQRGDLKWYLKQHIIKEGHPECVKELATSEVEYEDYTWYIEFVYEKDNKELGIKCREILATDSFPTLNPAIDTSINYLGWGRGSKNGNINRFPCSAPFPTPGSVKEDAYSKEIPDGIAYEVKQGEWYLTTDFAYKTRTAEKNPEVSLSAGGIVYSTFNNSVGPNNYIKADEALNQSISSEGYLIECNPPTWAYCILKNQYIYESAVPPLDKEIIDFAKIDKDRIIVFAVSGNDYERFIYIVDFSEETTKVTLYLRTKEDIDFGIGNPIKKIKVRYESDEQYYVYWIGKTGYLRCINIGEEIDSDYDFNTRVHKPVNFGKIHVSNVHRSGGNLLAGAYQFCYKLSIDGVNYTKASSHTNAVHIGTAKGYTEEIDENNTTIGNPRPVPVSNTNYKGFPQGTKTTCSVNVRITNIDRRYKYIKIFSIEAISGSGSYGSAVVNEIHTGPISSTEYYEFNKVYTGITNVTSGGLNISEVTKPRLIPKNITSFNFVNNRLVIAGYEEDTKTLTEQEKTTLIAGATGYLITEGIGSDKRKKYGALNGGYKNHINQQFKKSMANTEYSLAWVFEDEYGNNTEPVKFVVWDNAPPKTDNAQQPFLFVSDQTDTISEFGVIHGPIPGGGVNYKSVGYWFNSYGIGLSMASNSFPTWAKKAKIVRRKKEFNKSDVIYFTAIKAINGKLYFLSIPDLANYNSFEKEAFIEGDNLIILIEGVSKTNVAWHSRRYDIPNTTPLYETVEMFYQAGTTDASFANKTNNNYGEYKITEVLSEVIPALKSEPSLTTEKRATVLSLKLNKSLHITGYGKLVFGYIKKEKKTSESEDIVYYEETGYEIDLTKKRTTKKVNVFPGDCFMGTLNTAIRYDGGETKDRAKMNTVLAPIISRYNYAMAPSGWHLDKDDSNGKEELIEQNRDYAVTNNWNSHVYISDDYLKEKTKFKNTLIYTNSREANTKYNPYEEIPTNNIIDFSGEKGNITDIETDGDVTYVFFEKGIQQLFNSEKEMLNTTSGARVSVGDNTFFISKDNEFSPNKGTLGNVLKTNKGIYFIDLYTSGLNLIQKEVIDLSVIKGCSSFFKKENPKEINLTENTGYFMSYSEKDDRLFITLSNKVESNSSAKRIDAQTIEVYTKTRDIGIDDAVRIETEGYIVYSKVTAIASANGITTATTIYSEENILIKDHTKVSGIGNAQDCTIKKANFTIETIVYNEKIEAFEKTTDIVTTKLVSVSKRNIMLDTVNKQVLHSDTIDEENTTGIKTNSVEMNIRAVNNTNAWMAIKDSSIEYSKTETTGGTPSREIKIEAVATHSFLGTKVFVKTKNCILFLKGGTYEINASYLYTLTTGTGTLMLSINEKLKDFITIITETKASITAGTNLTATSTIKFTVNETFESELTVTAKDVSGLLNAVKTTITTFTKEIKMQPELGVVMNGAHYREEQTNTNTNKYVYDNGVLATDKEGSGLEVKVKGSEMKGYSTTEPENIKRRLNEYRYAIPYFKDEEEKKERQRGIYHKIKYIFVEYNRKFTVNSIKHFFRKSS